MKRVDAFDWGFGKVSFRLLVVFINLNRRVLNSGYVRRYTKVPK
jgi:hypothetical protein